MLLILYNITIKIKIKTIISNKKKKETSPEIMNGVRSSTPMPGGTASISCIILLYSSIGRISAKGYDCKCSLNLGNSHS